MAERKRERKGKERGHGREGQTDKVVRDTDRVGDRRKEGWKDSGEETETEQVYISPSEERPGSREGRSEKQQRKGGTEDEGNYEGREEKEKERQQNREKVQPQQQHVQEVLVEQPQQIHPIHEKGFQNGGQFENGQNAQQQQAHQGQAVTGKTTAAHPMDGRETKAKRKRGKTTKTAEKTGKDNSFISTKYLAQKLAMEKGQQHDRSLKNNSTTEHEKMTTTAILNKVKLTSSRSSLFQQQQLLMLITSSALSADLIIFCALFRPYLSARIHRPRSHWRAVATAPPLQPPRPPRLSASPPSASSELRKAHCGSGDVGSWTGRGGMCKMVPVWGGLIDDSSQLQPISTTLEEEDQQQYAAITAPRKEQQREEGCGEMPTECDEKWTGSTSVGGGDQPAAATTAEWRSVQAMPEQQ
ncbi:hypothetical protein niasHT_016383 [Heterodera trifolii]|uniref:Uncharacterized protein n=1 Tax=Heterodera trifolii TaxID=157864 RepID=A0ABD2LMW2_9BILA